MQFVLLYLGAKSALVMLRNIRRSLSGMVKF